MAVKASESITLFNVADGDTGVGISSITEYYAVSSSNTTAPSSWSTTVQTMTTTNKYLWNYEVVTYTDNSSKSTDKRVIGVYGNTGATGGTGATGVGISSVTPLYYASSSSTAPSAPTATVTTNSKTTYSAWNKAMPTYSSSYPYYYTCSEVLYSDSTRKWTTPVYAGALTTANQTAATANSTANTAKTTAESAKTTANSAIKSITNLYYASNSTTAPSKPTAHVTTNSATTYAAWNLAVPTYSSSYKYYYTCQETLTNGGTYSWSVVTQTTHNAALAAVQATANASVKSATALYYASASATAPSKPTAAVTTSSASTRNAWNKTLPTYSSSYPYLYTCIQTLTNGGTYAWTAVEQSAYAQTIANAAKTATNYLQYTDDDGLVIGDMTNDTLGNNVRIDSDSVDIRSGEEIKASYGEGISLYQDGEAVFSIGKKDLLDDVTFWDVKFVDDDGTLPILTVEGDDGSIEAATAYAVASTSTKSFSAYNKYAIQVLIPSINIDYTFIFSVDSDTTIKGEYFHITAKIDTGALIVWKLDELNADADSTCVLNVRSVAVINNVLNDRRIVQTKNSGSINVKTSGMNNASALSAALLLENTSIYTDELSYTTNTMALSNNQIQAFRKKVFLVDDGNDKVESTDVSRLRLNPRGGEVSFGGDAYFYGNIYKDNTDLFAKVTANESNIADHETRITALEGKFIFQSSVVNPNGLNYVVFSPPTTDYALIAAANGDWNAWNGHVADVSMQGSYGLVFLSTSVSQLTRINMLWINVGWINYIS